MMAGEIQLSVNGARVCLEGPHTLRHLAGKSGLLLSMLLIELNGCPLLPGELDMVELRDGDRVEFLRVAAGG